MVIKCICSRFPCTISTQFFQYRFAEGPIRCQRRRSLKSVAKKDGEQQQQHNNIRKVAPGGEAKAMAEAAGEASVRFSCLVKPTAFAILVSSGSFTAATIWQYENMRNNVQTMAHVSKEWLPKKLLQPLSSKKKGEIREKLNEWWNSLSEGERLFVPIAFLNSLVFLAWMVPAWQNAMRKYFLATPFTRTICLPMFFSTISHRSPFHILVNMFVLNSFMTTAVFSLGKEQFLAFYFSSAVFASLFSYSYKVLTNQRIASLGASGAIMAVLAYVCTKYPDTLLSIVFLPTIVFKAGLGIKMFMAVDFAGLALRWKMFDHAAHLGGALFGIFWCQWGNALIWQNRGPILEWWHKRRNASP